MGLINQCLGNNGRSGQTHVKSGEGDKEAAPLIPAVYLLKTDYKKKSRVATATPVIPVIPESKR